MSEIENIAQDKRDLMRLAQGFLRLRRCPGNRLIVDGFMCFHCGLDPTNDDRKCDKPMRKKGTR